MNNSSLQIASAVDSAGPPKKLRRYDLDWLRVIAFSLLIVFHVCLFFSHWQWFIKNNTVTYALNLPLMFMRQWRMPLVFMIAGAGIGWSLQARTAGQFVGERIRRILLPLLFGMLVIVPPQIYIERLMQGHTYSYAEFYRSVLTFRLYPAGNLGWHHLWYLVYVLFYTLVGLPVWFGLRTPAGLRLTRQWASFFNHPARLLPVLVGWFLLIALSDLPRNETYFVGDWKTHVRYASFLLVGYVLSTQIQFWHTFKRYRWVTLGLGVTLTGLLTVFFWQNWHTLSPAEQVLYDTLRITNYWCWLLCFLGFAFVYLNFTNRFIQYSTQAVYPFFILHQTILFIVAYHLAPLSWSWPLKFVLLTVATFGGCFLVYHFLIRPFRLVRPLFGGK